MTPEIDYDDEWGVIDSRDILSRRDKMEARLAGELTDEELEELLAIRKLVDEDPGEDSLEDGVLLIRDDAFVAYAEQLAEDIGTIDRNASWPLCHIDWEAAAEALKQDYERVGFYGRKWWCR